jgi:hypothetical protein
MARLHPLQTYANTLNPPKTGAYAEQVGVVVDREIAVLAGREEWHTP